MKLRLSILFAFAALVISSCSSSTGPVTIPSTVHPGPGSWWLKVSQYHDSTGALTEADTSTTTVLDTGLSLYGKTSVLRLQFDSRYNYITSSQHFIDTGYLHYEANGDYSNYQTPNSSIAGGWFTLPYGSQGSLHVLSRNSFEGAVDSVDAIFAGAGTGSFTLKGRTYVTTNIRFTERTKDSLSNGTAWSNWVESQLLETAQFSPEIGVTVIGDEPAYRESGNGALSKSYHSKLVDFQIK